jgi:hypothetical protein
MGEALSHRRKGNFMYAVHRKRGSSHCGDSVLVVHVEGELLQLEVLAAHQDLPHLVFSFSPQHLPDLAVDPLAGGVPVGNVVGGRNLVGQHEVPPHRDLYRERRVKVVLLELLQDLLVLDGLQPLIFPKVEVVGEDGVDAVVVVLVVV